MRVQNEIGDLIETFNRMVASLAEQRAGLNDTLSLLDSMLANAPIGLAFVDHNGRVVRVNQIFADLTGIAVSHHLGRTLTDLLPKTVASEIEGAVHRVFSSEEPVRNLELNGEGGKVRRPWTWLISAYPVRTMPNQVRWVGIIALDASDRKRSEEALRRSEKLAVTGRLAASIAHEINNPLEAITNLLFLLRCSNDLPDTAKQYVAMADNEVRRISEITQQTLRFYRQPTQPARVAADELFDSVLNLYQSRIHAVDLHVERDYEPGLTLFCFAGEIRQVFANLVGNAIDASGAGGRLVLRTRRSHDWRNPAQSGVRFAVADTGSGIGARSARTYLRGLLHHKGSNRNRPGAVGQPGDRTETSWVNARTQPGRRAGSKWFRYRLRDFSPRRAALCRGIRLFRRQGRRRRRHGIATRRSHQGLKSPHRPSSIKKSCRHA